MNKVVNINLGGIPFTLDEDAYVHLQSYLDTIHRHFAQNEGYREITRDIEARLAELFQERLDRRSIVNLNDVEEAIAIMGKPEDFGAEPLEEGRAEQQQSASSSYKTGKRLFRNTDDEVLGGVCSGISAYFGIQDPIWIRLLFVVLTLSGAFGIPIYIILWILMPEAKTAGDKLAMRGEPVNVSNIGRVIQEEVNTFSEEMSKFSKDWQKQSGAGSSRLGSFLRQAGQFVGAILVALGQFLVTVGRPLLILVGVVLMLSLAFGWAGTVIGFFTAWPTLQIVTPGTGLSNALLPINLLFLVGIPLVGLVLLIARIVFGTRIARPWSMGLTAFWALNIVSLFVVGSFIGRHFSEKAYVEEDLYLAPESNRLHLASREVARSEALFDIDQEVEVARGQLFFRAVDLKVLPAEAGGQWMLQQTRTARGRSEAEARKWAQEPDWAVGYDQERLRIPEGYVLHEGQEWRNQQIHLTLHVPVGGLITFDERTAEMLRDTELVGGRFHPADERARTWKVTSRGLECVECRAAAPEVLGEASTKTYEQYGGYKRLRLNGPAQLSLEKGERFDFQMQGPQQALKDVRISKSDDELSISVPASAERAGLRFYLTAPGLQALSLGETGDVRIRGFELDSLRISSRGEQQIKAELDARLLITEQHGNNELDLSGSVGQLLATMSNHARLDVDQAELQRADLQLSDHSQAVLPSSTQIKQQTDESSWVRQQR